MVLAEFIRNRKILHCHKLKQIKTNKTVSINRFKQEAINNVKDNKSTLFPLQGLLSSAHTHIIEIQECRTMSE